MATFPLRPRTRLAAALTSALVMASVTLVAAPAQAVAAPTGLQAQVVASQAVGLTWNAAGEDAYRVRFSSSSDMKKDRDTWDVRGRYLDWTNLDAHPTVSSPRLTPGGTYYFQVKAVTATPTVSNRKDLSSYSKAIKVTLPQSGPRELRPVRIKTTTAGPDALYVSWPTRGPGVHYVVRYGTDRSQPVLKWKSVKTDTSGTLVKGLKKNTRYYLRVRAIDADGKAVSDYSTSSTAYSGTTAADGTSPRISLVSYNIRKADGAPSWGSRRKAVASTILAQQPDVLALQEATPLRYGDVKQYDDIMGLLGSNYQLTTRAGSSGTKVAYDTRRFTVVKAGVKALQTLGPATRYASWAIFEDKSDQRRFFLINTHLEPGPQDDDAINAARVTQAREVLDLVEANAGDLPVVIAGDMNSGRAATPVNGQYKVFTGAGFVDLTANPEYSFSSGYGAPVEHAMDWAYNSANQLGTTARRTAYPVGTNVDYVYTSRDVRVATWRTVVNIDTRGRFVGTIPSDHNALALHLHLPR